MKNKNLTNKIDTFSFETLQSLYENRTFLYEILPKFIIFHCDRNNNLSELKRKIEKFESENSSKVKRINYQRFQRFSRFWSFHHEWIRKYFFMIFEDSWKSKRYSNEWFYLQILLSLEVNLEMQIAIHFVIFIDSPKIIERSISIKCSFHAFSSFSWIIQICALFSLLFLFLWFSP